MRLTIKSLTLYLIFIAVVVVYCIVVLILMIKLSEDHGDCTSNNYRQENQKTKIARKPRVFGYYFEHNLTTQRYAIRVESKLSNIREPMKLPTYWETETYELYPTKRTITEWFSMIEMQNHLEDSAYYDKPNHNPLKPYNKSNDCTKMHEWQEQNFPTCNLIHDTDLTHFLVSSNDYTFEHKRLISNGYFRDTFVVADQVLSADPLAFKTLRLRRHYDAWIFDRHRMDAMVLDRMKKSQWIIDIYGYCGSAGLFEFGSGDLSNWNTINAVNGDEKEVTSFLQRLKYAYQIANAISDLHTIDSYNGEFSSIVHADIHMSQFIWVKDKFKLNDFNRCHFMFWNKTSGQSCPYHYLDYNAGLFRSPEEYAYSLQSEKIDVYSMGNIFYFLLTKEEPFAELREGKDSNTIKQMIIEGMKPEISADYMAELNNDPSAMALIKAMSMCHIYNYQKRARAKTVRDFLYRKLDEITSEQY